MTIVGIRSLVRQRLLTAADTWERHLIVARLVGDARQVVDVGGLPGQLGAFLPGATVLSANVSPPADLIVPEDRLPFEDGTIEVVTSLDALEHVPPALRLGFVGELVRVAARRVVLCCPIGTPEHVADEGAVDAWYRSLTGRGHEWLAEHIELGLPTTEELEHAAATACSRVPGTTWTLSYNGDFRATGAQFREIVGARHRPRPQSLARFAWRRMRYRPDTALRSAPGPYDNRAFLVVDRDSSARR